MLSKYDVLWLLDVLRNVLTAVSVSTLPLHTIILQSVRPRSSITCKTSNARINVTSRRVRVTTYTVESKYFIGRACVYSLRYLAYKLQEPYCYLWLVWLYHIFLPCLINDIIFGKMLLNIKSMFSTSLRLCLKPFSF